MATPAGVRTSDRVLAAAARLFAERGFHATSMTDLGEAARLGRGALYYHIGSKEQLLYEISVRHVQEMVAFGETLLDDDAPVVVRLRQLSRQLLRTIADNQAELTVFFREVNSLTGKRRTRLQAVRDRFEEICGELLDEGVRTGELRMGGPLVVKGLLGLHNYSYLWLRPDGTHSPEDIADLFVDIALHGLSSARPEQGLSNLRQAR